jgi:enamine deaminase RidA (YjgF/YER057c/UK114 family)
VREQPQALRLERSRDATPRIQLGHDPVQPELLAQLRQAIDQTRHRHIVRIWNQMPGIHDSLDPDCDRYKHFNAGRFAAVCEWFGGAEQIPAHVPAASGIGHCGQKLVVHALATERAGIPLENPQQVPAFRYSRRYGPLPPCFSRATRVHGPRASLLIAGTAAITGEQSQHVGDLSKQLDLTLENLRILMRAAGFNDANLLARISSPRAYVSTLDHAAYVQQALREIFAGETELFRADLCRPELLVEIEGLAPLEDRRD